MGKITYTYDTPFVHDTTALKKVGDTVYFRHSIVRNGTRLVSFDEALTKQEFEAKKEFFDIQFARPDFTNEQ